MAGPVEQHLGCEVKLIGEQGVQIPVCMGGIAIRGCNQAEVCVPKHRAPGHINYLVRDPQNPELVKSVYEVRVDSRISAGSDILG